MILGGLRARVRALAGPAAAPVAIRSVEPLDAQVGAPAFAFRGTGPIAAAPPVRWDEDPETGAALPTGPRVVVAPDAFCSARIAHRHGWLPAGLFAAAEGDHAAGDAAREALASWLQQDIPGHGLAWAHGSDIAARLVHWSAALAWGASAIPIELRQLLAGSARWHLEHLQARLPTHVDEGARRIVHLCGLVIGGFTFPAVPGARTAWSEGLTGLRWHLPNELHPDGSARDGAPARFAEMLWYVALARAVTRANGAAFPNAADAALTRGARYLERLAGEIGTLPTFGEVPLGDLLATREPLAWSLWSLVRAWGLDSGLPAFGADTDPRLAWLGGAMPAIHSEVAPHGDPSGPAPEAAGKTWAIWVYRESGLSVAHMRIKGRPSRVVAHMGSPGRGPHAHPAPLNVLWDVGTTPVLADPGPAVGAGPLATWLASSAAHNGLLLDGLELEGHRLADPAIARPGVARVDGKRARIEGSHSGWQRLRISFTHERAVLLNQARLLVTDRLVPSSPRPGRHAVRLSWQLGPGWELTPEGAGYVARLDGLTLVIQLPPALSWTLHAGEPAPNPAGWVRTDGAARPAPCLIGSGGVDGPLEMVTSFEIR